MARQAHSNVEVDEMINYLSNPKLKAANVKLTYTQDQLEEYLKCSNDPIYFMCNYVHIVNVDRGLEKWNLWDFQKQFLQTIIDNRFVICKMSRQIGKSTCVVSYLLWTLLFKDNQKLAMLANKASVSRKTLGVLQKAYENIPLWMQQGILAWNKGSLELENGSSIIADSTSGNSARSASFNIVFLDELAFVPDNIAEDFMTSVYPTISSGETTKIIITSTPKGMNLFYRFWSDAINKRNLYIPFEAYWWQVPGRDQAWADEQVKQMGQSKFDQEMNCEFLGSSDSLVSGNKLATLSWKVPIHETAFFKAYELPQKHKHYFIVVDTSRGLSEDYSAFSVFDGTTMPYKQVARYRCATIPPLEYPTVIYSAASAYNNAFVLVEVNDVGSQIADILVNELEYEYMLCTNSKGRGGQQATVTKTNQNKYGIVTSKPVKTIGCNILKNLIESEQLLIYDFDTIAELTTFVKKGKSFEAESGATDDLVMTLVLFAWLVTQEIYKDLTDTNIRKKILEDNHIDNIIHVPMGALSTADEEESFKDKNGDTWYVDNSYEDPYYSDYKQKNPWMRWDDD